MPVPVKKCLNCKDAIAEGCGLCIPCALRALDGLLPMMEPEADEIARQMRERVAISKGVRHARPAHYKPFDPHLGMR